MTPRQARAYHQLAVRRIQRDKRLDTFLARGEPKEVNKTMARFN
jgi:hypothetical protein